MAGLQELEPSPVDEQAGQEDYFTPSKPPTRSFTLGASTHSAPYYLLRAQKYSTYAFSIFSVFHITNVALIPLVTRSVPASSKYLLLTRPYYQSALLEPLLVGIPLVAHIAAGALLRLHRRRVLVRHAGAADRADRRATPWPSVSWTSALGFAAVPLVLGHAALSRGLPLVVEGSSSGIGLDFVGHSVALAPVFGLTAYVALVAVAGSHIVWGWAKWLGLSPDQVDRRSVDGAVKARWRRWGVNVVNAVVVGLWMAGGVGVVARNGKVGGWVGKLYDELHERVPILGSLP